MLTKIKRRLLQMWYFPQLLFAPGWRAKLFGSRRARRLHISVAWAIAEFWTIPADELNAGVPGDDTLLPPF